MSVESATVPGTTPSMQEMPTAALPCAQPLMPSTRGPIFACGGSHRNANSNRDATSSSGATRRPTYAS